MLTVSLLSHNTPFYKWETGIEKQNYLPRVTQPACGESKAMTEV